MAELVEKLRSVTERLPQPATIAFGWDVQAPSFGEMVTDIPKVALILRNLVSNAFKFTEKGTVRVLIRGEDRHLRLIVSDTGIGVAAENFPMIFEMFRQLDSGSSRGGGVGLGLYIVKQMVQRLNGTVEVESALGRGSTFRITLPGYEPPKARLSPATQTARKTQETERAMV
jgi:signal transduction histidine kinase